MEKITHRSFDHGHTFQKKTFHKPTFCHTCSSMLWGIKNQGLSCTGCGFISHEKCLRAVVIPCQQNALENLKVPIAHSFVKQKLAKRRFCNVCRQRLDDSLSLSCTVCHYFAHTSCIPDVIHNCKVTSSFRKRISKQAVLLRHHWREGNLLSSAKCSVCHKSCSNSECLTGYQCLLCTKTAHASCVRGAKDTCDYGPLRNIVLPACAVEVANLPLWKTKDGTGIIGNTELVNGNVIHNDKQDTNVLRIYDGSLTNPIGWKNVRINKTTSAKEVLDEALKQFRIGEENEKYYLTKASSPNCKDDPERRLESYERPINFFKTGKPQLFLRHDSLEVKHGSLRVYAGNMNSRLAYVGVDVNLRTPAQKIIESALTAFDMTKHLADQFCLVEMHLLPNLAERYVDSQECVWSSVMEKRRTSVQLSHGTRYYLQPTVENDTPTTMFVSNLPTMLTHELYYKLMAEILGNVCPPSDSMTCFPNYGSLFFTFGTMDAAVAGFDELNTCEIEDKYIDVKVMPNIHKEVLSSSATPLLVFVNTKSGGGQGMKLMSKFRSLLNSYQVFDLFDGGPMVGLATFRKLPSFKILVCGGDGTFGWVLSCVDEVKANILRCKSPACALLPLGTGNDLARELMWGSGYTGGEDALSILTSADSAALDYVDRWSVVIDPVNDNGTIDTELPSLFVMNNYFGIGIDAMVCLDFHEAREEAPDKFNSRFHNKGVYVRASLKNMKSAVVANLNEKIEVTVDGQSLELPYLEGIVVLNISSWSAGAEPWGKERDSKFYRPTHNDGLLEVIGLSGIVHIGKIHSGLSSAIRLGQGSQINIKMTADIPVQVDGEPWLQSPCNAMIRPTLQPAIMLRKPVNRSRKGLSVN